MGVKLATIGIIGVVFLAVLISKGNSGVAAASDQVPSDLSLDLELAQQNPAPEQAVINNAEVKKAQITTPVGTLTVKPEEVLAPEVKTQLSSATEHAEQTTSEQVIERQTEVEIEPSTPENDSSPSGAGLPGSTVGKNGESEENKSGASPSGQTGEDNNVPGTGVKEPDDNAAAPVNATPAAIPDHEENNNNPSVPSSSSGGSSTPPSSNPPTTSQPDNTPAESQPSPTTPEVQPTPSQETTTPPPAVNEPSQPTPTPANPPSTGGNDNPSQPATGGDSSNPDNTSGDSGTVQGASTEIPWWRELWSVIFGK